MCQLVNQCGDPQAASDCPLSAVYHRTSAPGCCTAGWLTPTSVWTHIPSPPRGKGTRPPPPSFSLRVLRPCREFRSWQWLIKRGLRCGSLRTSRHPAPQLGLVLSMTLPQQRPGRRQPGGSGMQHGPTQKPLMTARPHRTGRNWVRTHEPTAPQEDEIGPTLAGWTFIAAALAMAATAAGKPSKRVQSRAPSSVGAPSCPTSVHPRLASKDAEGWMKVMDEMTDREIEMFWPSSSLLVWSS